MYATSPPTGAQASTASSSVPAERASSAAARRAPRLRNEPLPPAMIRRLPAATDDPSYQPPVYCSQSNSAAPALATARPACPVIVIEAGRRAESDVAAADRTIRPKDAVRAARPPCHPPHCP